MLTSVSEPATSSDTPLIQDIITTNFYLPIELPQNGPNKFWLVGVQSTWFENGVRHTKTELLSRCRDCNWGHNEGPSFVTTRGLARLGDRTLAHSAECKNTGRTMPIDSRAVAQNA